MIRRWFAATVIVVSMALLSACIGQIDRADFNKEVARRGGGLTGQFVDRAFAAFARQFPGGKVRNLSMAIGTIRAQVVVSADGRDLDNYFFNSGSTSWSRRGPVKTSPVDERATESYDPLTISGLRKLSALVDTALAKSGLVDPVVDAVSVDYGDWPRRLISVTVKSERGDYEADFTLDGTFEKGQRR